jgi:CDP-glycerol glycerophosphotransferase (TagB/SpsB family)
LLITFIQFIHFLALMQGKNLAFSASFGKAAGIGFADKSQAIRSFLRQRSG